MLLDFVDAFLTLFVMLMGRVILLMFGSVSCRPAPADMLAYSEGISHHTDGAETACASGCGVCACSGEDNISCIESLQTSVM